MLGKVSRFADAEDHFSQGSRGWKIRPRQLQDFGNRRFFIADKIFFERRPQFVLVGVLHVVPDLAAKHRKRILPSLKVEDPELFLVGIADPFGNITYPTLCVVAFQLANQIFVAEVVEAAKYFTDHANQRNLAVVVGGH
jgi:hypothetical protein